MKSRMLFVFLAGLLLAGTTQAATIQVWPIKLSLWPGQSSDSVQLTNKGEELVNVQIHAKTWDMDENGKFIETDTGDFVFFPRLLTIPPHEEKSVRVGYQGDFPALEKPYRLYIEELPPVRSPDKQENVMGVSYMLRLSLPLFVQPGKTPPAPEIVIDGVEPGEQKSAPKGGKASGNIESVVKLGIRATGAYHVRPHKVSVDLLDADGNTLAQGEATPGMLRILPQRRVFVPVPLDTGRCNKAASLRVKIDAEGLKDPYEAIIALTGENCQAEK